MGPFVESLVVSSVAVVPVVEVALASPLVKSMRKMAGTSRKSVRVVMSSRISDHWKEKTLPRYSMAILGSSLAALFWLIVLALIFGAGLYGSAWAFSEQFEGFSVFYRLDYLLASFALAVVYLVLRGRLRRV